MSATLVQVERQQQMQLQLRQRMIATQLALVRERMYWFGSFTAIATLLMAAGSVHACRSLSPPSSGS